MAAKKFRWFTCVTYSDKETVCKMLDAYRDYIKAWAFIIHDKDAADSHIHVLLRTYNTHSYNNIKRWFRACQREEDNSNTFVQNIYDREGIIDYLTHKNDDGEKHKYDPADIVERGLDQFEKAGESTDSSFDIIQDILDGVPAESLVKIYGREFVYHMKQYYAVVQRMQMEERKEKYNGSSSGN